MNLARSSVVVYIANASSAALGFGGIVLFARELGATTMGAFFLFQAAGGGLRVLADFGVAAAVKKRLSEHGGDNTATLSTAALVKTVLISLIVGGILLGSGWINGYLGATLASWLALSIVAQEASVLAINVLQGELRVAESAVIRSVRRVVWVVIGFWLVVRGWGIHGVVAGYIAGFAVVAVVGWARTSTRIGRPRRDQLSSLFAYAKYNSVSRLGSYSYNWLDIAVLGLFVSQASIGIYEYAWQVTLPLVFISRALGSAMFPQLSHWNSEMSTERIESVVSRSLAAAQFFLIPAFAGCVMLSEDIFRFVFHEPSTVGPLVLIILSFEKTVQSSAAIIRRSLNAVDAPDRAAFVALVTTIVLGSLLVVLVPPFGIVGAAVATTVGFSLGSVMYYRQISVYLTIELPVGLVVWSAVSATIMAATLHGLQAAFPIHSTRDLVIHIVSGAGIYLLISTTIPLLRREAIRPGLNAIS